MFAFSYYPEGDEGRLTSCSEQAVKGLSFVCFHLEAGWQKRAFPSPPWGVFQSACFHGLWDALNSLTITCLDHRRHLQGSFGGSGSQVFQVEYEFLWSSCCSWYAPGSRNWRQGRRCLVHEKVPTHFECGGTFVAHICFPSHGLPE